MSTLAVRAIERADVLGSYFSHNGTLVIQDITSLARRDVTGTLPYPPESSQAITASPDGRTLYYGAQQMEANIWMVKQAGATNR